MNFTKKTYQVAYRRASAKESELLRQLMHKHLYSKWAKQARLATSIYLRAIREEKEGLL